MNKSHTENDMENPEHREVIWQSSKLRTKVYVSLEDLRKLAAEFSANDPHVHIDVLSDNCFPHPTRIAL